MRFRIKADHGFALIPGGSFAMGATNGDIDSDASSTVVTVSPFYIQKAETTKASWDEVRAWGIGNGYTDLPVGGGKASNHPVQTVNWLDVVKWCNARSEKEGLTAVYTVSGTVLRTGTLIPTVDWSANGYRLPTEAEWEKAARGGVNGKRFPHGTDTIDHSNANFLANSTSYSYDVTGYVSDTYHPTYMTGGLPYTAPVASFPPNPYGLHDMAGNVWEWCWDFYGSSYYTTIVGSVNPRGPSVGTNRVVRGGGWGSRALRARCAARNDGSTPGFPSHFLGFRLARSGVVDGMVLVSSGSFTMGRTSGDTDSDAPPVTVTVSGFYAQQTETTKAQWDDVRTWATSNGYTDLGAGGGKASSHPAYGMSWWDAIKWCNARSQKEGLTPCYMVGAAVMKTGTTVPTVNWSANGYRLPTEAEWEKAARGGVEGKRFPWGTDTIDHTRANYYANSAAHAYDISGYTSYRYHPSYETGILPYTSPVGSFPPNAGGLYDMAGNVWEWCWDWYGSTSYVSGALDPVGPATGINRVFRGGSWYNGADNSRCVDRDGTAPTLQNNQSIGFRQVRSIQVGGSIQSTSNVPVDTRSPVLASQPQSITVAQNAPASFSVTATGSGTLTYQWQKDGVDIPGATSSTFSLANAKPWHIGDYTVKVTDANGTITSNAATLSLMGINSGIWKGLTSYYKLDSEASDRSVLGQDLTISGATPNPDRFSQSIGAFSFNGLGNSIYKSGLTGPDASSAQSISVWFKAGFPINDALLAGSAIDGNARFHISIKNGRLEGAHGNDSNFQYHEFGSATLQSGTWYHAVLTTTGNAGAMNAYLNGVAIGQAPSGTNTALTSNYWIQLGSVASSSFIYNFKGEIDDVRFYNRAISGAEVAALYAAENAPNNWRQTYFGSTSNAGDAADDADPDRDGLKNLLEYALNLSPNAASRVPASVQATGGNLEYLYDRSTAAFNGGTTYQVEWSDDLTTWSGAGVVETLLSDDGTTQQVKATLPAGSGGRRFVRLRVQ